MKSQEAPKIAIFYALISLVLGIPLVIVTAPVFVYGVATTVALFLTSGLFCIACMAALLLDGATAEALNT